MNTGQHWITTGGKGSIKALQGDKKKSQINNFSGVLLLYDEIKGGENTSPTSQDRNQLMSKADRKEDW